MSGYILVWTAVSFNLLCIFHNLSLWAKMNATSVLIEGLRLQTRNTKGYIGALGVLKRLGCLTTIVWLLKSSFSLHRCSLWAVLSMWARSAKPSSLN